MLNQLKIIADVTAKAGLEEEVRKILEALTDASRKEKGNISYHLHQDINNLNVFIIIEEWESQDAIDFHNQTPHFAKFKEQISDKFEHLSINVVRQLR